MVNHDRPAGERKQGGRRRTSRFHSQSTPAFRMGHPLLVVVLHVAQAAIKEKRAEVRLRRVQVVRPGRPLHQMLCLVVPAVVIDRVEPRVEQRQRHAVGLREDRIPAAHPCRVVIVRLGAEKDPRLALPRPVDQPFPELRRHHVSHVHPEAVHPKTLPVGDHRVHLPPGIRNPFPRRVRRGIFRLVLRVQKVVAVIQLHRLVPVVPRGRPTHHIVSRHPPEAVLRCEEAVCPPECPGRMTPGRRQTQRAASLGHLGSQVEEIVFGMEKYFGAVLPPE